MRKAIMMWALALCALSALGQTEIQTPSPAQSLSCLTKPGKPPRYPTRDKLDHANGAMRVQLKFSKPDEAPAVEVLFNSAREDMQDQVFDYLRAYRLPCLTPQDGTVSAVQEFNFSNSDLDATPLPPEPRKDSPPFCLVMPRKDMSGFGLGFLGNLQEAEHVVAVSTFNGDGSQPPEVKIIHSSGMGRFEDAVRERLAEYRMPCRTGREGPQSFQQQFSMTPNNVKRYGFARSNLGLVEFLRMTRDVDKLRAHYDFDTMACPFKVHYVFYGGGAVPNEAHVAGKRDPNKLPFLRWLSGLALNVTARQANGLFGSPLQINVPCGTLDLGGEG